MRINVSVHKNTKQWDKMEKNLLRGADRVVRVGWWDSRHPSGVPTAQVAAWNEEGHMNGGIFSGTYTPPRPFIRMGFLLLAKKYLKSYAKGILRDVALGKSSWAKYNKKMGEDMVKLLQETILAWDTPANSAVTISMKGFNDPLIDTGNMYDAVKYRIVRITEK